MKFKSQLFAALIAIAVVAAPIAANAERPHRNAARAEAPRNASSGRHFNAAPRVTAQRNGARNFRPAAIGRNQAVWNRGNFERNNLDRNLVRERAENHYAYQRGNYNHYPVYNGYNGSNSYNGYNGYAPADNCNLGGAYAQPMYGYGQPAYGYAQQGYGEGGRPALMAYRNRLLAQKANLESQLNSSSSFMERPYLRQQLAEVNKKLGAVNMKMGISGRGFARGQYGGGYGYNGYNGYGANQYYGQQGGIASALPMLGNFIH
ncbi:MAG: hypothetical protein ACREH9_04175 [Pseudomonadota bacterium]